MRPEVRSFDYINGPYDRVRAVLVSGAQDIFRRATGAAASRAAAVASALHLSMGAVEVSAPIDITVHEIEDLALSPGGGRGTRIRLEWQSATRPGLFPLMKAELSVYPLTATETQLDFDGTYEPPFGPIGRAIDAVIGRRIAEASVHRFVSDVAHHLRAKLGAVDGN
ncbi:MAG: hypothetical protein L0271_20740 [Gemmatimonadetes bacterium]|nr:hypothetical protein [Gemmatimonadota bacterium]